MNNKTDDENSISKTNKFLECDNFLQGLVNLCNNTESTMSITLCIGGGLITGTLIGGEEYFNLFHEALVASGFPAEEAEIFKEFGQIYRDQRDKEKKENYSPPQFIHLKDAHVFNGGPVAIPTNQGIIWRGRLTEIDGFLLGSISQD